MDQNCSEEHRMEEQSLDRIRADLPSSQGVQVSASSPNNPSQGAQASVSSPKDPGASEPF